jgi:hypothetical protein
MTQGIPLNWVEKTRVAIERNVTKRGWRNGTTV